MALVFSVMTTAMPLKNMLTSHSAPYAWGWDASAAAQSRYITQPVDHYDSANTATWAQAFFVNDTFWAGPTSDAPVFLYVGGEGPLNTHSVTRNFVVDVLPGTVARLTNHPTSR